MSSRRWWHSCRTPDASGTRSTWYSSVVRICGTWTLSVKNDGPIRSCQSTPRRRRSVGRTMGRPVIFQIWHWPQCHTHGPAWLDQTFPERREDYEAGGINDIIVTFSNMRIELVNLNMFEGFIEDFLNTLCFQISDLCQLY